MRQGSKKIFHIEAFIAKIMSVYKNYTLWVAAARMYVPANTHRMGLADEYE